MKYFFDTYALVEITKNAKAYRLYSKESIVTSILNVGELYYYFLKRGDEAKGMRWTEYLGSITMSFNTTDVISAMKLKHKYRTRNLSFIDCIGYVLATRLNTKFLTGDQEFKDLDNVEFGQ
jgi:uncharacterized protein